MIEKLISRAKSDRTDSIRMEAQSVLRTIVRDLSNNKADLLNLLDVLSRQQVAHLKSIVDFEKALSKI